MKAAVIGVGRVGLPLALTLIEKGLEVVGIDNNPALRRQLNEERAMPFLEPGYDQLLRNSKFRVEGDYAAVADCDYVIITVGTPLLHHIETDLSTVTKVIQETVPHLKPGATVISRSTTAPNTTRFIRSLIETRSGKVVGKDVFLACCPERLVEGKAKEELGKLPQIVGTEDEGSRVRAEALFAPLEVEILHTNFITAELVKLFNNSSRYAYFAISNVLSMIAMEYGAEPYEVIRLANHDYPRGIQGLPGLTAGTCLRKDFGMLSESYWSGNILVEAWRINESLPKFLVDQAKKRWGDFEGKTITVLGYSFKKDTDDCRDSLSPKLIRYLRRTSPKQIRIHDPFLSRDRVEPEDRDDFVPVLGDAVEGTDILILAMNHSLYYEGRTKILTQSIQQGTRIIDVWNVLGTERVFFSVE